MLLNWPNLSRAQVAIDDMSTPNFVDPESRKTLILAIEVTVTSIAVVFVAARFYARTIVKNVLGKDDWCMLAAMVWTSTALVDLMLTVSSFRQL